jgi:hypothetical protein
MLHFSLTEMLRLLYPWAISIYSLPTPSSYCDCNKLQVYILLLLLVRLFDLFCDLLRYMFIG